MSHQFKERYRADFLRLLYITNSIKELIKKDALPYGLKIKGVSTEVDNLLIAYNKRLCSAKIKLAFFDPTKPKQIESKNETTQLESKNDISQASAQLDIAMPDGVVDIMSSYLYHSKPKDVVPEEKEGGYNPNSVAP